MIVRDHEDDIRNEALEIHACTSVATAAGGADHVPSATQRQRHRCLEENGRGLWMLQLALERVGSLQRLELHGQTIKPSEVCASLPPPQLPGQLFYDIATSI